MAEFGTSYTVLRVFRALRSFANENDVKDLKFTLTGTMKAAGYTASATVVGGLVGGPPGALVGGIAGSIFSYWQATPYKSIIQILDEMDDETKEKFVDAALQFAVEEGLKEALGVNPDAIPKKKRNEMLQAALKKLGWKAK